MKARLPPSALRVLRMTSGSPGSTSSPFSASSIAAGELGKGGSKLAVTRGDQGRIEDL